jgi:hypothetical protein
VVKKIKLLFETVVWANSLLNYLKKARGGECPETNFWEKHKKTLENVVDCFCEIA